MKSPMKKHSLRSLIIVITLALALSSLGMSGARRKAGADAKTAEPNGADCGNTNVGADAALNMLKDGNRRWTGPPPPPMTTRYWDRERNATATCQKPFAVVVTCMDSRVPPELIFDRGLGDLFVIRVAGPVLDAPSATSTSKDQLASLEYALVEKNVKLVVVLGHTDCGAVKGAVGRPWRPTWVYLPELLRKIGPAITYVSDTCNRGRPISPEDKTNVNRVSIRNAENVARMIPTFNQAGVKKTWALYDTGSGTVAFEPPLVCSLSGKAP